MSHEHLIKELDFVLTHPLCSVENLENFYNNCLFLYETVPLIVIVNHIRKGKPKLLNEWSSKNQVIHKVLSELEITFEDSDPVEIFNIMIETDLRGVHPTGNGIYKIVWSTNLDEERIDSCFKGKTLRVKCHTYGDLELVGMKKAEGNEYNLYLKKKEEY